MPNNPNNLKLRHHKLVPSAILDPYTSVIPPPFPFVGLVQDETPPTLAETEISGFQLLLRLGAATDALNIRLGGLYLFLKMIFRIPVRPTVKNIHLTQVHCAS